jgi:choline dehydrogenase-like flavoprotein
MSTLNRINQIEIKMDQAKHDITRKVSPKEASEGFYDAVIIGAGIAGAVVANELSQQGVNVLLVEAGSDQGLSVNGYQKYLDTFYTSTNKNPNSPYPDNQNAPAPRAGVLSRLQYGQPDSKNYIVQNGPVNFDGTYERLVGGTTMHWQANTPRMLPEDFETKRLFNQGIDWPISYQDLEPYYRKAEKEMGVSGNVESQNKEHIDPKTSKKTTASLFAPDYVYPMHAMPPTYLDKVLAKEIGGTEILQGEDVHRLEVLSIPQARNGIPNKKYNPFNDDQDYIPVGAVSNHQDETGERCQGNTNCTPICPVQAKYDARKTLAKGLRTGKIDLLVQTVASKVVIAPDSGRVSCIEYKSYDNSASVRYETGILKGKIFVLAGNAIENARLMLASNLPGSSSLMGRNLMNHIYLLSWALMPKPVGAMRGSLGTSGIEAFRSGYFRKNQAAFHMDIINNGWSFATGAPYSDLISLVDSKNKFGKALKQGLIDTVSRQVLLTLVTEVMPDVNNRITVDPAYSDQMGNLKPVISFHIPDYTLNGLAYGRRVMKQIFRQVGAGDYTQYNPLNWGYLIHDGEELEISGGNHFSGTHIMGSNASNSVVDTNQRSWDHKNLFLTGSGSMPTIGTSNPTLTLTALCFKTTETILKDLTHL